LAKLDQVGLYLHLPDWLPQSVLQEFQAEAKDPKTGKWKKIQENKPNEALDLFCYILALTDMLGLSSETFKWDKPWCAPLDQNNQVVSVDYARKERTPAKPKPMQRIHGSDSWSSRL
jgi:phage terminase large subunit GpA-like protein